jgi:hypothetical protein
MVYLTSEELISRAETRGVDLTIFDSDELQERIFAAQDDIESYTHRIFEQRTLTETYLRHPGNLIQCKHYPILVDENNMLTGDETVELIIDGVPVTAYVANPDTGSLILNVPRWNYGMWKVNDTHVTYVTCPFPEDPTRIHPTAKSVCFDLVMFDLLKSPDGKLMSSMKDGEFSVSYSSRDVIMERLNRLKRPLMMIIGSSP